MEIKRVWFIWLFLLFAFDLSALKPLINSPYARANPGKIPYSSCSFESFPANHFVFLLGGGLGSDLAVLRCWSEKHGVASRIPLRVGHTFRFGLGIGLAGGGSIGTDMIDLHRKTVGQLLGEYGGFVASAVGGMGSELQWYRNFHGIAITSAAILGGFSLNWATYNRFDLSLCRKHRCMDGLRGDPEVLYAHTVYDHNQDTYLFEDSSNKVGLQTANGERYLSQDGIPVYDESNFAGRTFASVDGHTIHLVNGRSGKSDKMILLEKDGVWAYQTLEGTSIYREANELMPIPDSLEQLEFEQDDYQDPVVLDS